jgi:hypothetical protein
MNEFLDMAREAVHNFRYTKEPSLIVINRDMEPDLYDYFVQNIHSPFAPQMSIHDKPRLFGIPVVWGNEFEIL